MEKFTVSDGAYSAIGGVLGYIIGSKAMKSSPKMAGGVGAVLGVLLGYGIGRQVQNSGGLFSNATGDCGCGCKDNSESDCGCKDD